MHSFSPCWLLPVTHYSALVLLVSFDVVAIRFLAENILLCISFRRRFDLAISSTRTLLFEFGHYFF